MTSATPPSLFPEAPASADEVLDGLDPEQREVATALQGPVCVLAGAGTGKTRAITHRIAYGVRAGILQPASVLAVTFTNRAAGEMRGRLRQLGAGGVQARTFHSAALRQLRHFWPRVVGGSMPELLTNKFAGIGEACQRLHLSVDRAALRDIVARTEVVPLTNFIGAIVQAEQLGVSISKVLQVQSEQLRIERRQRAEEQAAKAPIKMLFPLVGCIFPSLFIVILGPAIILIVQNLAV